jgi:hypothetical protein
MYGVCLTYQRLLRAYERTFVAWGESREVDNDEIAGVELEALEEKYRTLAAHQQWCPVCLMTLGKMPVQSLDLQALKEKESADLAARKQRRSKTPREFFQA